MKSSLLFMVTVKRHDFIALWLPTHTHQKKINRKIDESVYTVYYTVSLIWIILISYHSFYRSYFSNNIRIIQHCIYTHIHKKKISSKIHTHTQKGPETTRAIVSTVANNTILLFVASSPRTATLTKWNYSSGVIWSFNQRN